MWVSRYEGKIGDCQILMMGGDDIPYNGAERVEEVAGYTAVNASKKISSVPNISYEHSIWSE